MRRTMFGAIVLAALAAAPLNEVRAGIILDYSPGATGATVSPAPPGYYNSLSTGQNFGEFVSFAAGATVTGMDIYTGSGGVFYNPTQAVVRLWSGGAGGAGALISETTEAITAIDSLSAGASGGVVRVHVDFANPLTLAAGASYWIGMSGVSSYNLGQVLLEGSLAPGDGKAAQFSGQTFQSLVPFGDMAFRLEGTTGTAVPEPASWLMGASAGALGLAMARRRRRAA